jgi:hypothetical protein
MATPYTDRDNATGNPSEETQEAIQRLDILAAELSHEMNEFERMLRQKNL